MASPFDFVHEVTADEAPLEYPAGSGKCYQAGDMVRVKTTDQSCFYELILPADAPDKCFPEYCVNEGWPTRGYRNHYELAPGAVTVVAVPSIPGCAPPARVCFDAKGCIFVGYDADPVLDATDGTGADCNPTCRDLIDKYGNCVTAIHIHNAEDAPIHLCLSYYCN